MRFQNRVGFLRRNSGYIIFLFVIFIFMQIGFRTGHRHHLQLEEMLAEQNTGGSWSSSKILGNDKDVIREHPIPQLMEEAEAKYKKKLEGQSKTLTAAVEEYKRRYRRPPPKGFDEWWDFAQKYQVKMTDEYDGLMNDLEPFWALSGQEIRRRTAQVGNLPSINLVRIQDGVVSIDEVNPDFHDTEISARARGFKSMVGKFVETLPDMEFPINTKAEGRVLIPWEHKMFPNLTLQDSSDGIEAILGGPFIPDWRNDGNLWESWRRTCTPQSSARSLFSSIRIPSTAQVKNYFTSTNVYPGSDFSFPKGTFSTLDFCDVPYDHYTQGHFFSDWRAITSLYPVFSPAKAQGFMDIKIPSHYYYGSTRRYTYGWDVINLELQDFDTMEVPWEYKIDKIFWRGATTGGGSHPSGFAPYYQRHRFIRMTSDKSNATRMVTFPDPAISTSNYVTATVPLAKLNEEIMDTAFVKAVASESYPGGQEALERDHRFGDTVPLGKHWAYKYLIDMDGMSYSGRFLAFLASDSVPIKATVYEEFFSDWIQPWVHFIPLSSTYKEIYNIHAYFSGPTQSTLEAANSTQAIVPPEQRRTLEADRRLRRIARAGKQWKKTVGRTLDMEAYVYRLCLEWARLWADDPTSTTLMIVFSRCKRTGLPHHQSQIMYSTPINRSTSPYYGAPSARPSDGQSYYGSTPMAPVPIRPLSRAPSPMPTMPRPISRASSPIPPGVGRSPDMRRPGSTADFQIEKAPKSPGPYGRPTNMPQADGYNRDELMYRQQIAALIAAKDRQIAANGHIPAGPTQLILFFRTKNGVSHCLDFPIDIGYANPPSLDILLAACKAHPRSDFSNYGDRDALYFPQNLPLTPSLEIANHPILDSIRTSLFPTLPPGHHLFVVKDRLDIINSGCHLASQNPAVLSNDGRSATIVLTLPVKFRGGVTVIRDSLGHEERLQGSGGPAGDMDWVAFPADCEYRIEPVQKGCCATLSYGVYVKPFNPSGSISDALIIPSDGFFDLLAPILNTSRGRSIAFHLNYDYIANPAEVTANTIVPQLKGADLLIYNAFKLHKLSPEVHWTAGGYIWPADRTLEYFEDDITNPPNAPRPGSNVGMRQPFGAPRGASSPAVRGAFGSNPNDQEFDAIRSRVEASGAVSLGDANITVLSDWSNLNGPPTIGRQRVYFVSNGELEKLVVNALVVIYIP